MLLFWFTVYGTLKRLKFFWPYLSIKNPKIGKNEDTPLHFVAYHGLSDVFDFMIEELQSVEECLTKNKRGTTPLHNLSRGHAEIIRSLRRKMDFEFINTYLFMNILEKAVKYGYLDCIKALIENNIYQKNLSYLLTLPGLKWKLDMDVNHESESTKKYTCSIDT